MTRHKPNPLKQLQGAQSHAKGSRFEERLDRTFEAYRAAGIASIAKTPEPMRVVRNLGNGRFEAYFVKKAQPDYEGCIKGGRAVVFEAKYTDKVQLLQSRVGQTQSDYMDLKSALGARCFVIAGFGTGNVYKIPWAVWRDMKTVFGRKYITEKDDLTAYKVPATANDTLLLL